MPALVIDAVVVEAKVGALPLLDDKGKPIFDVAVIDKAYTARRQAFARKVGVGVPVTIRIEPADEAVRVDQYRHLFGHVFQPVVDAECGHTKAELCLMAKAQFMPDDGRKSLTELNAEEMAEFIRECEVWLHTEYPDAFALHDRRLN